MRADYADDVAANLVHPFDDAEADACARELHGRIVDFLGPVSDYLQWAERVYLFSRPEGVVRRITTE